ncbi:hypothetical protein GCM10011351_16000 [Paraliobacillus quinghaiensis]|uniref:Uncharacterized protein n=1 Tax=Paraliobacillus quinghaiensis TaxID=470815 RepID=A0A917TPC3_9BACI|nr:hypothetical protein [Paraliobacillus quinghaiensis]GGM30649.1 hypothetical protein GCM10011351_16000 [Paraliobacillus quinghaiensis]
MKKLFFLFSFIGLIFVIVIGGWALLSVNEMPQDPRVKNITESKYTIETPKLAQQSTISEKPNSEVNSQTVQENVEVNLPSSQLTEKEIKQQYRDAFQSLELQTLEKVNNLLLAAFNEFQEKKERGEKIAYYSFFIKYKSAAEKLEENTNVAFDKLYSALQEDLSANGYDPDAATEFKERYEKTKNESKTSILNKALDYYN